MRVFALMINQKGVCLGRYFDIYRREMGYEMKFIAEVVPVVTKTKHPGSNYFCARRKKYLHLRPLLVVILSWIGNVSRCWSENVITIRRHKQKKIKRTKVVL